MTRGSAPRPGPPVITDDVYRQRFVVSYDYAVHFTRGVFDPANATLAEALGGEGTTGTALVVVDDGLVGSRGNITGMIRDYAHAHADLVSLAADPMVVPGGERAKNDPDLLARLQREILALGIDRHSYVVAVGGGAILDLVGYAAASSHRGVRHVRIPTTVLAQNDSGVGVKNGVNAFGSKNYLGAFAPPWAVINDADFLELLDPCDRRSGIAEAIKVALIRDPDFFRWLEDHAAELAAFDPDASDHMIRRSAELHMHQIARGGDPFELGSARPLDFGHWAAHRLETLTGFRLRHGEAVAIGIALDSRYSVQAGLLAPGAEQRVCDLLDAIGLPTWHEALERADADGEPALLRGLADFREHLGGQLTVTLLEDLGVSVEVHQIDAEQVSHAIAWLGERSGRR